MKKTPKALPYLPSDEVVKMPISMLTVGDYNVRSQESKNLEGLAQSLLENGQEQNMSVIPPIQGESAKFHLHCSPKCIQNYSEVARHTNQQFQVLYSGIAWQ